MKITDNRRDKLKIIVFGVIGVFNTLFDIALYTALRAAHQSVITANVISASAALIGSYILNSRLTFKAKKWSFGSFFGFLAVTLFGLWVLQTGAIYVIQRLLLSVPARDWWFAGSLHHLVRLALPKLLATSVTFVWNYLWYNKVIFRNAPREQQVIAALDEL